MRKAWRRLYAAALLLIGAVSIGVLGTRDASAQTAASLYYISTPGGQLCTLSCGSFGELCTCFHLPPIIV